MLRESGAGERLVLEQAGALAAVGGLHLRRDGGPTHFFVMRADGGGARRGAGVFQPLLDLLAGHALQRYVPDEAAERVHLIHQREEHLVVAVEPVGEREKIGETAMAAAGFVDRPVEAVADELAGGGRYGIFVAMDYVEAG